MNASYDFLQAAAEFLKEQPALPEPPADPEMPDEPSAAEPVPAVITMQTPKTPPMQPSRALQVQHDRQQRDAWQQNSWCEDSPWEQHQQHGGSSSSAMPAPEASSSSGAPNAAVDAAVDAAAPADWEDNCDDDDCDDDMEDDDAAESAAARLHGVPWVERGPPPPSDPKEYWRKQRWRPTTQRWSRRGGRFRGWWDVYYNCPAARS